MACLCRYPVPCRLQGSDNDERLIFLKFFTMILGVFDITFIESVGELA